MVDQPQVRPMSSPPLPLLRFRCTGCGYGASSRSAPHRCPMCGGTAWQEDGSRPFEDLLGDLHDAVVDASAPLARESSIFPGVPLS